MKSDLWGIVLSFVYVGAVLAVSALGQRFRFRKEIIRKAIHILVGNWVFLTPLFQSVTAALAVPLSFVVINYFSLRYHWLPFMEREGKRSYGTVYYALSLSVCVYLSFVFSLPYLRYIGILTMAYGDGFAALLGERYGRVKIPFFHGKSAVGSLVVFVFSFFITGGNAFLFTKMAVWAVFGVSFLTAVYAVFLEGVFRDGADNLSLPLGSGIFASILFAAFRADTLLYLAICLGILIYAYRKKSVNAEACLVALPSALSLYVFGDSWLGFSILLFFVSGSLATAFINPEKKEALRKNDAPHPRGWVQVICNSLPAVIVAWLYPQLSDKRYLLVGIAVFAAAAADTFSSEIGTLLARKTYHPLSGKPLPKGLSGAVSWEGFAAGILGSALISLLAFPSFRLSGFLFCLFLGILGTYTDSLLGIFLQRKYRNTQGLLQDHSENPEDRTVGGCRFVSNNTVNLLSLFIVMFTGLILITYFW